MIDHLVETCPDDLDLLRRRLGELVLAGTEIISVLWQANRVESDQISALEGRGSFVIIGRIEVENPLRTRGEAEAGVPLA